MAIKYKATDPATVRQEDRPAQIQRVKEEYEQAKTAGTAAGAKTSAASGSPLNRDVRDAQVRQAWASRPATERFAPATSATGPAKAVPRATVSQRLNALSNRIGQREQQLTNMGLQLNQLETAYNAGDYSAVDKYNALANQYNTVFNQYVADVDSYNKLYRGEYRDQGIRNNYARSQYGQAVKEARQATRDQGSRQLYQQRRQEEALRAPQLTTLGKENEQVVERTPNRFERVIGAGLSGTASGFTTAAGLTLNNQLDEHDSRTLRRKGASVGEHSYKRISGEEPREAGYTYAVSPAYQQRMARAKLTADGLIDTGRRLNNRSTLQTDIAKEGLGETGQMLVDLGVMAVQMAADIGIAAATGGSMLVPLGIRSYGNGYLTAEQMGFTGDAAQSYALGVAAVEVLSEKMFSVFGIVNKFARGAVTQEMSQRVIDGLVKRLASSAGGRTALNRLFTILFSAGSEGLEEVVAGIMEPVIRKYTLDRNVKALKEIDWQETLYEGLLGGILGGLGGAVDLTNTRPTYWKYYSQGINESIGRYEEAVKKHGLESKEALQAAKEVWDGGNKKMNQIAGTLDGKPVTYHQLAAMDETLLYGRQNEKGEAVQGPRLADSLNLNNYLEQEENARKEAENQRLEAARREEAARLEAEEKARVDAGKTAQSARDVGTSAQGELTETSRGITPNEDGTVRLDTARSAQTRAQAPQGAADLSGIPGSELTQEEKDELQYGSGAVEDLGKYSGLAQRMGAPKTGRRTGLALRTPGVQQQAANLQQRVGGLRVAYTPMPKNMPGYVDRSTGTIYLNSNVSKDKLLRSTLGHELVHYLKKQDPQLIGDIIAYMEQIGEDVQGEIARLRPLYEESIRKIYAQDPAKMQKKLAELDEPGYFEEEVAANFIGRICEEQSETLDRLAAEEPGLLQRIVEALRRFLRELGATPEGEARIRVYEQAIARVNEALAKAGQNENAVRTDDGVRYAFAGENAREADVQALEDAQRMEEQGVAAETIFRETGWFKGMDGKWRFEIDDSGMEYRRQGDLRYMDDPEYREYLELWYKIYARAEGNEEDIERVRELDRKYGGVGRASAMRLNNGQAKLSDIITHDELFDNYPELRDATVIFKDLPRGDHGSYNRATNTITLSDAVRNAPEETIVHEVQHAIQAIEGFASGSNPDYWKSSTAADARTEAVRSIRKEIEILRGMLPNDEEDAAYIRGGIENLEKQLDDISFFLYQNTAGEIEARDVTARRKMSEEQRRNTMPDTGNEDTVFAERWSGDAAPEELAPDELPAELIGNLEFDDDVRFNLRSMEEDKEDFRKDLSGIMDEAELDKLFDTVDEVMYYVSQHRKELDYGAELGRDNRPFLPVKPNSDEHYKFAIDFSTLCRKRILIQAITERLQQKLGRGLSPMESVRIRQELIKLRDAGKQIDVACGLCYVEAARFNAMKYINDYLADPRAVMIDYLSKKNRTWIRNVLEPMQQRYWESLGKTGKYNKQKLNTEQKNKINEENKKLRATYEPESEQEKALLQRLEGIDKNQFLSVDGLTQLASNEDTYPIYDAFITFLRDRGRSKAQESRSPYYKGDLMRATSGGKKLVTSSMIQALNEESGSRMQSWSDFEVLHMLDLMSAIMDLALNGAKAHCYTKVPDLVRVAGETGVMYNMSLIPAGDTGLNAEGELDESCYDPHEGVPFEVMRDLRDEFPDTVGNICIGINDAQIRALMASPDIDFIIPYHASGLPKELKAMLGLHDWDSYQQFQNEMPDSSKKGDRKKPALKDWFSLEEARSFDGDGYAYMEYASRKYLKYCDEHGLVPIFSMFTGEDHLTPEPGYWKLLIDRKMVNQKTGEIIEQQVVRPKFRKDTLLGVMEREINSDVRQDQQEAIDTVVDRVLSGQTSLSQQMDQDLQALDVLLKDAPMLNAVEHAGEENGEDVKHRFLPEEEESEEQTEAGKTTPESDLQSTIQKLTEQVARLTDRLEGKTTEATEPEQTEAVAPSETESVAPAGDVRFSFTGPENGKAYDYTKPFSEQLDDYENGTFPEDNSFFLGGTPDVLKKIGLLQLPLTIDARHIPYALYGTYPNTNPDRVLDHIISKEELAKLPEKIADPIAIIEDRPWPSRPASQYKVDVIVSMIINGKQTLVPISINTRGYFNGIEFDVNGASTVHGNSDTIERLRAAIEGDREDDIRVYYVNKEKTTKVLLPTGNLISSTAAYVPDGFVHSITDEGSPVKMRISSVTESQQFKRWFKNSKVVDENGRPLVVYHATDDEFYIFDRRHLGKNVAGNATDELWEATAYVGFWFNTQDLQRRMVTSKTGEFYLSIRNPLELGSIEELTGLIRDHSTSEDPKAMGEETLNWLQRQGYDGLKITDEEFGGTSWVPFDNTQIKSATDNVGFFDRNNPDIRFSFTEPVETAGSLVALHNLDATKLGKALDLGGFPMPSIAVTRTDIPHTNFGDITLVMDRSTVDPEADRRNKVYSADAWTPTFPETEYEADEKAERRIRDKYYDLERKYGRDQVDALYSYANLLEDQLDRNGGVEGILDREQDNARMKQVYMLDRGIDLPGPTTKKTVERMSDAEISQAEFLIRGLGEDVVRELVRRDGEKVGDARRRWRADHGEDLKRVYEDWLRQPEFGFSDEEVANVMGSMNNMTYMAEAIKARDYLTRGPETTREEPDYSAREQAIAGVDQADYEAWLEDLFAGAVKDSGIRNGRDMFTPAGDRRSFKATHYPVTLDNIARAMAEENEGNSKNVSGFHGTKTLRGGTAYTFRSIPEMHQMEGRLQNLTEDEALQLTRALDERLNELIHRIDQRGTYKSSESNPFIRMDSIGETLEEIAETGSWGTTQVKQTFAKYSYDLTEDICQDVTDLLTDINNMPVHIFEAKPQRAVRFDEVRAAIVPESTDPALIDRLREAGVEDVRTYTKGDTESRLAAVNAVPDVRFSFTESGVGAEEEGEIRTVDELVNARKRAEQAKRYLQKTQRQMRLNPKESGLVDALMKGTLTEYELPRGVDKHGIMTVYRAKQAYREAMAPVDEYNKQRREQNYNEAERLTENSDEWKDKKNLFSYARETARRIFRDMAKDDAEAGALTRTYIDPIREHEAEKNRMVNRYNERIKKLNIETKKRAGNKVSEAYAIQYIGELEFIRDWLEQMPDGETRGGVTYGEARMLLDEFWRENPNFDEDRIHEAVAEFRSIYDEIFAMVNEARVLNGYAPIDYRKGYFPHFTSASADNIIQSLANGMGFNVEVTELPTSIAGTTHLFRPGIQWSGHMLKRTGNETDYNVLEGWDRYIPAVANIIYHTEDIQRLRALETVIRRKYSDTTVRDEIDSTRHSSDMTAEEINAKLDELFKRDVTQLNYFVQWLREYTNQLAGKKAELDRNVEKFVGRKFYQRIQQVENRVAANMLGGNISSAMTNFVPLFQAWGNVSTASMMRAMWDTGVGAIKGSNWRDGSSFLVNRRGYDAMYQTMYGKAKNALFMPFNWVDDFVSETVVRARYYDELKNNPQLPPEVALAEADVFAGSVMADRAIGELPTIFNSKNPLVKIFTMFQVEVNNDLSHLIKDVPKDVRKKGLASAFGALLKYILGVYMFNDLFEWLFGRRVSIDPLSMLNDLVGDATGYELPNMFDSAALIAKGEWQGWEEFENGKGGDFFSDLVGDLKEWADDVPFISGLLGGGRFPIQAMLPEEGAVKAGYDALRDILKPEEDQENPDAYDWNKIYKTVKNPLYYWAMPAFGGQLRKIAEGIYAYTQHGSYSQTKQGKVLQYPILGYDDLVKSMIFGKTTTRYGKEWIESDFDSLTAPQTEAYINLVSGGSDPELIYQILHDLKGTERTAVEKAYALASANLDDGERIALFSALDRDKEAENFADLMLSGLTFRQCADVLDEYRRLKDLEDQTAKGDEGTAERRRLSTEFSIFLADQGFDDKTVSAVQEVYDMQVKPIRYDWLTAAGIHREGAMELALDWSELEPRGNSSKVTDNQKIMTVADAGYLSENERHMAIRTLLTDDEVVKYNQYIVGYQIPVETYGNYIELSYDLKADDLDGDGKGDAYSLAKKKFAVIDRLPLQPGQKTALAIYASGNKESTVRKYAPWLQ